MEVAVSKEFEAVRGNYFLVQFFADRNAAVLLAFGPDESDSVFCDLGACEVHSFAPACPGTQADFNDQSEKGALTLAVVKKLCDLFMRQPGHFFFGDSELAHAFQRVWRSPFSKPGQLAKTPLRYAKRHLLGADERSHGLVKSFLVNFYS